MLAGIRNFAKSWPARILMGLLAISFVGWGANQVGVSAVAGDWVVKAGSRTVDSQAFKREYDNQKKRIEQQQGQPITPEIAEQNKLDTMVLQGVATREAFSELLQKAGIRPSDKLVLDQIEKIPAFFDPISGRFDKKTFQQRLGENGLRPQEFDAVLRDEMATQHWAVSVQNGLAVPRSYGALASVFALESRDLSYFVLTPGSVPAPPKPTDAQLQAFIAENKQALTVPETRIITVVPFTPQGAQAASTAPIDPAELAKRYQFRKDTLSKPETRTLVQIPVKDQAAAQAAAARLQKGEAPAAVAKSLGVDAVTYDEKPLTAVADRKVGQAAFKMQAGQVAAVQGDLGLAVVKVVTITQGREVTLEEARPMLEAEIRKDMVAEKVYAQTQAYDDAHQGGATLAEAAAKAGVAAQTIGPVSAQGVDDQGRQLQGFPPKILETAFGLPPGGESEITDLGEGAYFAVKVDRILPPHVRPLEEIRGELTQAWTQREIVKALEAKANDLEARIKKGESLDAAAASAGVSVVRVAGLTRQTAQSHPELGREILARAFASKPGESWVGRAPNGIAIGQVGNVRMDAGPTAAQIAEQQRGELTQALFREMAEAAQTYARAKMKVKVDAARARAAAGFEPLEKKGAAEKKK
ncbi:MAG: SurA N-terminal domain-containing protein [Phenylobacterium sp.]|uniref:peptidylprolyl isomerase n=1 Tax=Phenylobacterium sp. TaxID=1871053 RepID=UPI001A418002|nr:peptidylprolyl isomerase [Phenylobacterium sp.]MBL8555754.1 SurA N-terminal domain-containing protein [Phenylobacterium sp.]